MVVGVVVELVVVVRRAAAVAVGGGCAGLALGLDVRHHVEWGCDRGRSVEDRPLCVDGTSSA